MEETEDVYHSEIDSSIREKKEKGRRIKLFAITLAAVLTIAVISQLMGTDPTGHFIIDTNAITLEEMAYKESVFGFISNRSNIPMTSARISGTVVGNGSVKVYLSNGVDKKLVYSNKDDDGSIPFITGFAVHKVAGSEEDHFLEVDLDNIEIKGKDKNIISGIKLKAVNNAEGLHAEKLRISWDPDNNEKIKGIKIAGTEFWGYDIAGSPLGNQPSDTLLTGWSQKLPENKVIEIDEIEFDSDMRNKEVNIDLSFNLVFPGFRLGKDRILKVFLDLSGEKESYITEEGKSKQTFILEEVEKLPSTQGTSTGTGTGTSTPGTTPSTPITGTPVPSTNGSSPAQQQTSAVAIPTNAVPVSTNNYPGFFSVSQTSDGKLIKRKGLNNKTVSFTNTPDLDIEFRIVEDPKYKEIFEETEIKEGEEKLILHECEETCVLDRLNQSQYEFVFEIDEGTGFNVTDIEFS